MFTTILKEALEGLTAFGTAEIAILLFVVAYYELRFKIMNRKQTETDYNVISLENNTLKNVNEVRTESQKRLDDLVEQLQSEGNSTEEVLNILSDAVTALGAEHEEVRNDLSVFMLEARTAISGLGDYTESIGSRAHNSRMKYNIQIGKLRKDLEQLRLQVDSNKTQMCYDDDAEALKRRAEVERLDDKIDRILQFLALSWDGNGPMTNEEEVFLQDHLVATLKEQRIIPDDEVGDSADLLKNATHYIRHPHIFEIGAPLRTDWDPSIGADEMVAPEIRDDDDDDDEPWVNKPLEAQVIRIDGPCDDPRNCDCPACVEDSLAAEIRD